MKPNSKFLGTLSHFFISGITCAMSLAALSAVSISARADVLSPTLPGDDAAEIALKAEAKSVGAREFTAEDYKPGRIRHLVLFRYVPSVTPAQKEEVISRFLALQREAVRNGHRYIVSIETGKQNSGEGADQGLEQGFIVTLSSEGDRNYYVGGPIIDTSTPEAQELNRDYFEPAHQAFKDFVGPLLASVVVFDMKVEEKAGR